MQNFWSKKHLLSFITILIFAMASLIMVSCGSGGGSDYDNPDEEYYSGENSESVLIEPATLYSWIKNGNKTGDGQPVFILDTQPNPGDEETWFAGDVAKVAKKFPGGMDAAQALDDAGYLGHIPGSLYSISHSGFEVTTRNDGPMDTDHQVGTGELITQMLQKKGITKDTVIVLTQSNLVYPGFCPARLYLTLRYWGISKKNIKILNGSTVAWADYIKNNHPDKIPEMGLQKGLSTPSVKKSNIDVADFPKRFLDIRATIGEVINMVDSGKTTNGTVALLDARQPPTPFYFDNISEYTDNISNHTLKQTNNLPKFVPTSFMPIDFNGMDTNGDGDTTNADALQAFVKSGFPYPINISAKAAAFDGEIKGSKLIKGKNGSGVPFNIAAPAFINTVKAFNGGAPAVAVFKDYKKPSDEAWNGSSWADNVSVADMFSRVLPDKNQTIVVYCNSGAMASTYWLYLTEVLGYNNVKVYDGSWIEWGNQVAFEPDNLSVVRSETYTWFPMAPNGSTFLNMPKLLVFGSGDFTHFHIEKRNGSYYAVADNIGKTSVSYFECEVGTQGCPVDFGGNLSGDATWDTISRSEKVVFRPTSILNTGTIAGSDDVSNTKEYNDFIDWPRAVTHPYYSGAGSETKVEDKAYDGFSGGGSAPAPEAFVPQGGGC